MIIGVMETGISTNGTMMNGAVIAMTGTVIATIGIAVATVGDMTTTGTVDAG